MRPEDREPIETSKAPRHSLRDLVNQTDGLLKLDYGDR